MMHLMNIWSGKQQPTLVLVRTCYSPLFNFLRIFLLFPRQLGLTNSQKVKRCLWRSGGCGSPSVVNDKLLTWLRYSLFVVLYPAGVAGEMGCLYKSIPAMKDTPPADAPFLVKHMLQPMLKNSLGYLLIVVPVYVAHGGPQKKPQ